MLDLDDSVYHDIHVIKKYIARYGFVGKENVHELIDPTYLQVKQTKNGV